MLASCIGKNIGLGLLLGMACFTPLIAQQQQLDLGEALRLARIQNAGLERDRLSVQQQERLAASGLPAQPAQVFFSGEEFNFSGQTGIQSFNLQQTFYLPGVQKAQKEVYQKGAVVAASQMALTDQDLQRQVQQAFYQLQYTRQAQDLAEEQLGLYQDFLAVATAQMESGETGKLPQLAAQSRLGKAQLNRVQAEERYRRALSLFNTWLGADTLYGAAGQLSAEPPVLTDSSFQRNPHLQLLEARRELAVMQVDMQRNKLLPQINSGVRLQEAFGIFPVFGYQLGVNVPLLRKSYRGRIEAAEVGVKVQEAALEAEQQRLQRTLTELRSRLKLQRQTLSYLEGELQPVTEEQRRLYLQAYREGAISYLEYLDSLEQTLWVRKQYLQALYQLNFLRTELHYWLGRQIG